MDAGDGAAAAPTTVEGVDGDRSTIARADAEEHNPEDVFGLEAPPPPPMGGLPFPADGKNGRAPPSTWTSASLQSSMTVSRRD